MATNPQNGLLRKQEKQDDVLTIAAVSAGAAATLAQALKDIASQTGQSPGEPGNFIPVQSTNLQAVAYDPLSLTLYIMFNYQDAVYSYSEVPPSIFAGLLAASSKGQYFNANIRDSFEYEQIG